ncbi:hypothetical protein LCGC14_1537840 [marine sediment metagenome]|uniref:Uncharacterized protein n=1 Tax=marine sediment metagenome TaxID=412755 RepID=A0A0F9IU11_9ZZZZ
MKKKTAITKFLMVQLLFWCFFSLILSSTPVSFQNVTKTNDSLNLKSSAVNLSNVSVISDGFGGFIGIMILALIPQLRPIVLTQFT